MRRALSVIGGLMIVAGVVLLGYGIFAAVDFSPGTAASSAVTGTTFILAGSGLLTVGILVLVGGLVAGRLSGLTTSGSVGSDAVPGQAVILGLQETGVEFNSGLSILIGFTLQVQRPGEAPYQVAVKQAVPRLALAQLVPGSLLPVRIALRDPMKVVIDWDAPRSAPGSAVAAPVVDTTSLPAGQLAQAFAAGVQSAGSAAASGVQVGSSVDLLRTGQRVLGVLTEFADTGLTVRRSGATAPRPELADDPLYAVVLQLHVPNLAPIDARYIARVPRAQAPNLQLGLQLNVAVDPSNPSRSLAIDWGDVPT